MEIPFMFSYPNDEVREAKRKVSVKVANSAWSKVVIIYFIQIVFFFFVKKYFLLIIILLTETQRDY